MHSLIIASYNCFSKIKLLPNILPISTQVRWRRFWPRTTGWRKPRWLPMAKSKVFRIPQHPFVAPEEIQLQKDLLEEHYRILGSLKASFQDEIQQKLVKEEEILLQKQKDEEEFRLLLEENKKENERVKIIREETLEKEFQEKLLEWMQMAEVTKQEQDNAKCRVEEIIRKEKEKCKFYITLENIDEAIEKAIDNPSNINFTLSVDGTINWEGKPSLEYEANINQRVAKGKITQHVIK